MHKSIYYLSFYGQNMLVKTATIKGNLEQLQLLSISFEYIWVFTKSCGVERQETLTPCTSSTRGIVRCIEDNRSALYYYPPPLYLLHFQFWMHLI